MNDLLVCLSEKIELMEKKFEEAQKCEKKMNENINSIKEAFKKIEILENEDLDEISEMLDEKLKREFNDIRPLFVVFDKFSRQSQIIEAKKILVKVEAKVIEYMRNSNKDFFDEVDSLKKKYQYLTTILEELKNYDETNYYELSKLFSLLKYLKRSDITPEIIKFYMTIMINNANTERKKSNNSQLNLYNKFIERLKKIKNSFETDEFKVVKELIELFDYIVSEKKGSIDDAVINSTLNYIKSFRNNIKIKENEIDRLEFIFHLYNVGVSYDDSQLELINKVSQYFKSILNSVDGIEQYRINCKLLESLASTEPFNDYNLLFETFEKNSFENEEQLEIICLIDSNNSTKIKSKAK